MPVTAALLCLATNIYFEARSEGELGQRAVAEVTLNRVASDRYPDTICDVVWDDKQFSWTHDGKSDKPKDKDAWLMALWIASDMMMNDQEALGPMVQHYHSKKVSPSWAKAMKPVAAIGNHIFYRS